MTSLLLFCCRWYRFLTVLQIDRMFYPYKYALATYYNLYYFEPDNCELYRDLSVNIITQNKALVTKGEWIQR